MPPQCLGQSAVWNGTVSWTVSSVDRRSHASTAWQEFPSSRCKCCQTGHPLRPKAWTREAPWSCSLWRRPEAGRSRAAQSSKQSRVSGSRTTRKYGSPSSRQQVSGSEPESSRFSDGAIADHHCCFRLVANPLTGRANSESDLFFAPRQPRGCAVPLGATSASPTMTVSTAPELIASTESCCREGILLDIQQRSKCGNET